MEGGPMVSYSTGSMNSLVDKLTKLKQNNPHQIVQELHADVVCLKEGFFGNLQGHLAMNLQVKAWMKNVRELVYDIEDWTDKKLVMTDMGDQLVIEEDIRNFIAQIEEARERCTSYNLLVEVPTERKVADFASNQTIYYSPLLFEEKAGLFGVKDPANNLVNHLTDEQEKKLMVVSIVGMEGLGKTTLAKEIYSKLQGQFDCHAFVTVGRRPSTMATLMDILCQVKPKTNRKGGRRTTQDLQKVVTVLWEYLSKRRYFIIVDGLWSTQAWKVINCALPNKNRGSRVLTTTCISDVARCCSVYPRNILPIKALSEENSRSLYLQSIRKQKNPADIDDVSSYMLEICRGMPLAITVAAGLLAMKPEELAEQKMFEKSILSSPEKYFTSEGMIMVLHMSYASLSLPLKSCFMYLSVYREDYIIKKDNLIRLWAAEGFIPRRNRESSWLKLQRYFSEDLLIAGERYFNELISRRLIQPVFDYDDDQPVGCTVHGVILDFIRSLSTESNFVTVGADLSSGFFPGSTNTIRRFSLNCYDDEEEETLATSRVHLSKVRSLTVLGEIRGLVGRSALAVCGEIEGTSLLPSFKHIRVLDLEDNENVRNRHLEGIGDLVLLRYLGLGGTCIDTLPEHIGKLVQLETLDLRWTNLRTLPESIVNLKGLVRLLLDSVVQVNFSIFLKMKGLEEVSTIRVDSISSLDVVHWMVCRSKKWEKKRPLKVLGLSFAGLLPASLSKYDIDRSILLLKFVTDSNIRSLSLHQLHGYFIRCLPTHTSKRRKLEVILSGPVWGGFKIDMRTTVTHMHIEVTQLEGISDVLGDLPHLVILNLVSRRIKGRTKRNERYIINEGAFPCLMVLWFTCKDGGTEMEFRPRAMPVLRRLRIGFSAWKTLSQYRGFEFGIEHLTGLTRVHAIISCEGATVSAVEEAEYAIREQARQISTTVEFTREHEDKMWGRNRIGPLAKLAKAVTKGGSGSGLPITQKM